MRGAWALAVCGLLLSGGGCGGDRVQGGGGAGAAEPKELPDGFVQTGCSTNDDCNDANPCTDDGCGLDHVCTHATKDCSAMNGACAQGTCNPADGTCSAQPANDGASCTTSANEPGLCTQGSCAAVPACTTSYTTLDCSSYSALTTDSTSGASLLDDYACATGETGPENAYPFRVPTDRAVTVSLTGATADFDLIILEGSSCLGSAPCDGHATTAGNGNETVTFQAKGNTDYLIVVDGKNGQMGSYTLHIACAGGVKPIGNLACNMTYAGNTTSMKSTSAIASYACDPQTPGPEDTYQIPSGGDTQYRLKLTGLSSDLDLVVVDDDGSGPDPTYCEAQSTQSGTADESLAVTGSSYSTYDVIVDSKTTGGPYQLEVDCPPDCNSDANQLSCSVLEDTRSNDDATHSKNLVSNWQCDASTTGPEVVYPFSPTTAGMYTVTLDGLSADLDLIVTAGLSTDSCDASSACVASSVKSGNAAESVTFAADTSHTYYIAVDGKNGAVGTYHLKLSSSACGAPTCQDGYDSLSCSSMSTTNRNDAFGSTTDVSSWACDSGLTGPEFAHVFTPSKAGMYTVKMIGLKADLDLLVLQGNAAGSCDPTAACVASSQNSGTADEAVTFAADPAKSYFLVVDGKNGATSSYTLAITDGCP